MAEVFDEANNAVEVFQKPSPVRQTGKLLFCVALSQQAASLPSKARLAKVFYLPESPQT